MSHRPIATVGAQASAILVALFLSLSSAGCRGGEGSDEAAAPPPIEECARYEETYRACGHKLGPAGEQLLARHAERLRASLILTPDASERVIAETRRACAEAERRVAEACR